VFPALGIHTASSRMQRVAEQFCHLGAAKKKADREAQEEAVRRAHAHHRDS